MRKIDILNNGSGRKTDAKIGGVRQTESWSERGERLYRSKSGEEIMREEERAREGRKRGPSRGWRGEPAGIAVKLLVSRFHTAMADRPADRMNNLGRGVDIDVKMHFCLTTFSRARILRRNRMRARTQHTRKSPLAVPWIRIDLHPDK